MPLCYILFLLMIRRPPRSTRTDTLFPYTTLFRSSLRSLRLQILHDGKPDRTHRGAFLTVDQPKATSFEVNLAPFEIDDFSAPPARHRNQPEDLGMYPVAVASLRVPENAAYNPVLSFAEPAVAALIFRFRSEGR